MMSRQGFRCHQDWHCLSVFISRLSGTRRLNLRRLILSLYLVVFLGAAVTAGLFFWDSREEYNRLRRIQHQNEQRLADAQQKLAEQERVLE